MGKASGRTILRYTLMQLPELAVVVSMLFMLQLWFAVSLLFFVLVVLGWIAKDALLYFFTWRAYDRENVSPLDLIGRTGKVKERLAPSGYIIVGNILWRAETGPGSGPVEAGTSVRIVEAKGLTLLVEPEDTVNRDWHD